MKRTLFSIAAAVSFLLVPLTTLKAQSAVPSYNIPFSFNAQGIELPAGRYIAPHLGLQSGTLRGDHKVGIMFVTGALSGKEGPAHLTFYQYGDKYFLRQVWDENGKGAKIPMGAQERQLVHTREEAKAAPAQVAVNAER